MTRVVRAQVAVVGAGPAGMAAAIEVARAGGQVMMIDEAHRAGGQIYRQPPAEFTMREAQGAASPSHEHGHHLLEQVRELGLEMTTGATVWGVKPGRLLLEVDGEPVECAWERLILATGAYDRSVPFPGWTLPGVVTAGAAQVMVRGYLVQPGTRALVAGSGPLLLPTVAALATAGVEIVAALEACGRLRLLRALPGVLGSPMRRREARYYARTLRRLGVPFRMGWTIFGARGDDHVRSAVIGRVDRRGRPRRDTALEIDVDLVCTGFGLSPQIELARVLGCEMHYTEVRGGWVPVHDSLMCTSQPGVYVAGEIAGIGGADVAIAEGRLAGLAAVTDLGLGRDDQRAVALERAKCARGQERRAADAMLRAFTVLPGLSELADDDTMVCRCEDVSLAELRDAVAVYGRDLRSAKMATRAGMGPCQGRVCQAPLADLLRYRLGGRPEPPPCPSVQMPVKPVAVTTVVGGLADSATPAE